MSSWKNIWNKMPKNIFRYNKRIDKQVASAVFEVLGVPVKKVRRIVQGEINHTYKIITPNLVLLARVFQYKGWLEKEKLMWIEKQLARRRIPHAKILYFSKSVKYFPFGFMITEFIEGTDGRNAVNRGEISLGFAYKQIGKTLRKVHKIKLKRFGDINNGKGGHSDFLAWKLQKEISPRLKELSAVKGLPRNLSLQVRQKVTQALLPFRFRLKPVLNHGDPNRENAIWSSDRKWVLIDWDNAISSTWVEDYADLTFWAGFRGNTDFTPRRLEIFKGNFFKTYGKHQFNKQEVAQIEYALHIIKCIKLLTYYHFEKQNRRDFLAVKEKLGLLLQQK
jgi:thiamine kinase-like enzyme